MGNELNLFVIFHIGVQENKMRELLKIFSFQKEG